MLGNILTKLKTEKLLAMGILGIFLLILLNILSLELTFYEAYYWIYSQYLSWGYFDHPPMVAIIIRAGTSIFGNNEFGVRIITNMMFFIGTLVLWNTTKKTSPKVFYY